jgi:hypothetical protein
VSFFATKPTSHRCTPADMVGVSIKCVRKTTKRGLRLSIGPGVARTYGLVPGTRVKILWGRDQDAGSILVAKVEVGGAALRLPGNVKTGALSTVVGCLPESPIADHRQAQWRLRSGTMDPAKVAPKPYQGGAGFVLKLPQSWWDLEASPTQQALRTVTAVPMPAARERAA